MSIKDFFCKSLMTKMFVTSIFVTFLLMNSYSVYPDSRDRPGKPIFDGNDGLSPQLKLINCYCWDQTFEPKIYSEMGFKSTKVLCLDEGWIAKHKEEDPPSYIPRKISIHSYYFQHSGDAEVYPYLPDDRILVLGTAVVPEWQKVADIGDKTLWSDDMTVVFIKNNVLVYVHVNSKLLDKAYTVKVARIIAGKL